MGRNLNPGNGLFQIALDSPIYVDKTDFAARLNHIINTSERYICVSRPRRFGKTMAADMLCAYYGRNVDSSSQFEGLSIADVPSFKQHLNRYDVIKLNIQNFLSDARDIDGMLIDIFESVMHDLERQYPEALPSSRRSLPSVLESVYAETHIRFVVLIDEWDSVFRMRLEDTEGQRHYLDWLRSLLKDREYVALAYMTGILPIKKYGQHSALNMFTEVSMTDALPYSDLTGFTQQEVAALCNQYERQLDSLRAWYDGYDVDGVEIYNPRSVVQSLMRGSLANYWTQTESFEALRVYVTMDMDGLRSAVVRLAAGQEIPVDVTTFQNDMTTFNTVDDVLTLLVHLGYLTYNRKSHMVRIPNREVLEQFASVLRNDGWQEVARSIAKSDELLTATLSVNAEKVADLVADAHEDAASILRYNDENSLACAISLAYYAARRRYVMVREMPTGKGFADVVFLPRVGTDGPALVVELKADGTDGDGAIDQIRERRYARGVDGLAGEVLLVGITYNPKTKVHQCSIERAEV